MGQGRSPAATEFMHTARRQNAAVSHRQGQPRRLVTREPGSIRGGAVARVHAEQTRQYERDPIATPCCDTAMQDLTPEACKINRLDELMPWRYAQD